MRSDTQLIDGYRVTIKQDEYARCPFALWDSEPPFLAFYAGRHESLTAYNDAPENLREVLHLLPADTWQKPKRSAFIAEFLAPHVSMRELAEEIKRHGCLFDAVDSILSDVFGSTPSGWLYALKWFDLVKSLLSWAGIPVTFEHSKGYSQGDVTLCLVVLTDPWFKATGADRENAKVIMQSAFDVYSAWAWGDVYEVAAIEYPANFDSQGEPQDWEEIEDASCGGFYGSDHESSGLLSHAREAIEHHKKALAAESEGLESALFCNA